MSKEKKSNKEAKKPKKDPDKKKRKKTQIDMMVRETLGASGIVNPSLPSVDLF